MSFWYIMSRIKLIKNEQINNFYMVLFFLIDLETDLEKIQQTVFLQAVVNIKKRITC